MTNSKKKRSPLSDRQFRHPGAYPEKQIQSLRWNIIFSIGISFLFVALTFVEWWQWYRNLPPQPIVYGIAAAVIVVYSSVKIRKWLKQIRNYRQGLIGEREVSRILHLLAAKGYTTLDAINAGNFDIDHVVISERGIFVIETKAISKPARGEAIVLFDGNNVTLTDKPPDDAPVREAVRHAHWLRETLGKDSRGKLFKVKPVIVYLNWYYKDTGHNKDIWVLNPKMLEVQFEREPISLTELDIERAKVRLEPYSTISTDESVAW